MLLLPFSCATRRDTHKKKERKEKSNFEAYINAIGSARARIRVFISCVLSVTSWFGKKENERKEKKKEKEEKMSPLSRPSRLKDDSMCDKSSL